MARDIASRAPDVRRPAINASSRSRRRFGYAELEQLHEVRRSQCLTEKDTLGFITLLSTKKFHLIQRSHALRDHPTASSRR
jgi:hypothetical protein